MKHLFVPYELALKLKEKGFDEPCFGYYLGKYSDQHKTLIITSTQIDDDEVVGYTNTEHDNAIYDEGDVAAPLYQQVIDWFLDNHQLFITILPTSLPDGEWVISDIDGNNLKSGIEYYPDSTAYNKAIEEALKLI